MEPPPSARAQRAGTQRWRRAGHVRGRVAWAREGRRGHGGGERRAEGGARARGRSVMRHAGGAAVRARGLMWGVRAHLRTRSRPPCPVARRENLRRKSAPEFGARARALTPQTAAPGWALGLRRPSHRLRACRERATAGWPLWAKPPQRCSRERRSQLFRTFERAACPDFRPRCSARAARIQRARDGPEPPASARLVQSSLHRPVSKGSSGPTSGLHSSRRWRTTYRNEATLASIWAVSRAVAIQKGGSPGSLGCCGAERGRKHLRQARPQRHGRAACLFGAGPGQPQRGVNAGRRGREAKWPAGSRPRATVECAPQPSKKPAE